MSVKHPYIKWADRKDAVFMKIDVQDSQNTEVIISKQSVKYSGTNKKGYVVVEKKISEKEKEFFFKLIHIYHYTV